MKKWLFNPFIYIAGAKALLIGLAAMIATGIVGYLSHTHFDGAIDMHVSHPAPITIFFAELFTDWLCISLFFFGTGMVLARSSPRVIDVAGTAALARWPALLSAIIGFGINLPHTENIQEIRAAITPSVLVFSMLSLVPMIWMIALLYNAFCVSCGLKGGKAIGGFIAALALAEIASKLIIHQLSNYL